MKIQWSNTALIDLDTIYNFIARHSKKYAAKEVEKILESTGQIIDFPLSGIEIKFKEKQARKYRFIVLSNYKIVYSIRDNDILIETVFDTRQNPRKLRKKLKRG